MQSYEKFQSQAIRHIIPDSQRELLKKIMPVALDIKRGKELPDETLKEFSYLVKIWRDREVLWAQYPARLLACKTMGQLVDYLYRRYQAEQAKASNQSKLRSGVLVGPLPTQVPWCMPANGATYDSRAVGNGIIN